MITYLIYLHDAMQSVCKKKYKTQKSKDKQLNNKSTATGILILKQRFSYEFLKLFKKDRNFQKCY